MREGFYDEFHAGIEPAGARSPGLDSGTAEREYPLSGGE